ncbi:sodium:solute symporter [bacterium]|nr:sodium:solute symporter [bacterium]
MQLPTLDLVVLVVYFLGVVGFGCYFVRRSRNTGHFMAAGGSLPGWAVGLSIFGTYLSSNTFIGYPGAAYAGNWNRFVFSLSLPLAAWVAVKFFVPFYRSAGEISAYHHLEKRFGPWARTYALVCYLLMQVARMGAVMFGVAIALDALTGWGMAPIIIGMGVLVTLYTLLGGIEAVIWTDVVQSIVLTVGAVVVAVMLLVNMPGGPSAIFAYGAEHGKLSLGSFGASLGESTFWVVLLYGIFANLTNFGIDQSFVQRYHTARDAKAAGRSVWMAALLYMPISLLFLFIGTCLFAYYHHAENAGLLGEVRAKVAAERLAGERGTLSDNAYAAKLQATTAELKDKDIGDKVLPHFVVTKLPAGLAGLLFAAIFAAAMSSIDTSLNSSATVILTDIYQRYIRPGAGEKESMRVLYASTLLWGTVGTGVALAMIGQKSLLDVWWKLSGIFTGAILGLFLLGFLVRRAGSVAAATGVVAGVALIAWLTFSPQNPFHTFCTSVFGSTTIVLVGFLVGLVFARRPDAPVAM